MPVREHRARRVAVVTGDDQRLRGADRGQRDARRRDGDRFSSVRISTVDGRRVGEAADARRDRRGAARLGDDATAAGDRRDRRGARREGRARGDVGAAAVAVGAGDDEVARGVLAGERERLGRHVDRGEHPRRGHGRVRRHARLLRLREIEDDRLELVAGLGFERRAEAAVARDHDRELDQAAQRCAP